MTISVQLYASSTSQTGYTATTGTDNNTYYYKYTGGSDENGNVTETVGNGQDIVVTLQNTGYTVSSAAVVSGTDPESQLSFSHTGTTVTVGDSASAAETDAEYTVTLQVDGTTTTFVCDPKVTNTSN